MQCIRQLNITPLSVPGVEDKELHISAELSYNDDDTPFGIFPAIAALNGLFIRGCSNTPENVDDIRGIAPLVKYLELGQSGWDTEEYEDMLWLAQDEILGAFTACCTLEYFFHDASTPPGGGPSSVLAAN